MMSPKRPTSKARKTASSLLSMAGSEFADVQVQGLQVLAEITAGGQMQAAVLEEGGLDCICNGLASTNEDVQRCAISALANLTTTSDHSAATQADSCKKFMDNGTVKRLVAASYSKTCMQLVRESCRALANISQTLGVAMNESVALVVQNLAYSHDTLVRQSVGRISTFVGDTGLNMTKLNKKAELPMPSSFSKLGGLSMPSLGGRARQSNYDQ